jgi:hypothetical protein
VSEEIAREIKNWSERKGEELSPGLSEWIDYQLDLGVRSKQRVEGQADGRNNL